MEKSRLLVRLRLPLMLGLLVAAARAAGAPLNAGAHEQHWGLDHDARAGGPAAPRPRCGELSSPIVGTGGVGGHSSACRIGGAPSLAK